MIVGIWIPVNYVYVTDMYCSGNSFRKQKCTCVIFSGWSVTFKMGQVFAYNCFTNFVCNPTHWLFRLPTLPIVRSVCMSEQLSSFSSIGLRSFSRSVALAVINNLSSNDKKWRPPNDSQRESPRINSCGSIRRKNPALRIFWGYFKPQKLFLFLEVVKKPPPPGTHCKKS